MNKLFLFLTPIFFVTCSLKLTLGEDIPCEIEKWKPHIAKFLTADAETPPPQNGTLFVGSSSIRLWDLEKYFPQQDAINRGFGGSEICQTIHFFEQLILKHKPSVVIFYAGDNDIANGKSAEQVHREFLAFWKKLQEALPETRLLYIAIKPSLSRWKLAPIMNEANKRIATECEKNKKITFIDIWQPMLGEDGKPRKEIFMADGLHLNDLGYTLWTKLVNDSLESKY